MTGPKGSGGGFKIPGISEVTDLVNRGAGYISNNANNAGSWLANGVNAGSASFSSNVGAEKLKSYFGDSQNIANDFKNLGSRLETVGQRTVNSWAALATGKWNNLGRTIADNNLGGVTNIETLAGTDQADISKRYGETIQERGTKEAISQAEAQAKEDASAAATNASNQVASTISGIIGARNAFPGRDELLLSKNKNRKMPTLLSMKGA